MDLSNYLKAGYTLLFIETTEIKRAVRSIVHGTGKEGLFKVIRWDAVDGINDDTSQAGSQALDIGGLMTRFKSDEELVKLKNTMIVVENFDWFLEQPMIVQGLMNASQKMRTQRTCVCMVGTSPNKITSQLKDMIPVIPFRLPTKDDVWEIATGAMESAKESLKAKCKEARCKLEDLDGDYDTSMSEDVVDACLGLTHEEIENVLFLSFIEKHRFDLGTILDRKRQAIRQTGFMDFLHPEPIDQLGGLQPLKDYISKRMTAFEIDSLKPKLKSILFVGFPGTGKTLAAKVLISLMDVPGIILDIGALKGSLVGQTEENSRRATRTIDAFGRCVVVIDEIEKAFAGSTGQVLDSGVSAGLLGHFLTWMQERQSEGVLVATSNNLDALPPEFLRAGRWDAIFFVDLPIAEECKEIINIMNKRWMSDLPTTDRFIARLVSEGWTGAEIEQLAKESHFDEVDTAMDEIPILSRTKKDAMEKIRLKAKQYRSANRKDIGQTAKPVRRQLTVTNDMLN
jgi:hypothetical protein